MAKGKTITVARSAKSGQFVKKSYTSKHKSATEIERYKIKNTTTKKGK